MFGNIDSLVPKDPVFVSISSLPDDDANMQQLLTASYQFTMNDFYNTILTALNLNFNVVQGANRICFPSKGSICWFFWYCVGFQRQWILYINSKKILYKLCSEVLDMKDKVNDGVGGDSSKEEGEFEGMKFDLVIIPLFKMLIEMHSWCFIIQCLVIFGIMKSAANHNVGFLQKTDFDLPHLVRSNHTN